MNLLIQLEKGIPANHPISEKNLKHFYPDLVINNPPEGYARFIRKAPPELDQFEKIASIEYVIDEELSKKYNTQVWTDSYIIEPLNEEDMIEIAIQSVKDYNDQMMEVMNAPYPAPDDGNYYVWSISSKCWVKKPSNFDQILLMYHNKLKELNLLDTKPEDLENIEPSKKAELEKILAMIDNGS